MEEDQQLSAMTASWGRAVAHGATSMRVVSPAVLLACIGCERVPATPLLPEPGTIADAGVVASSAASRRGALKGEVGALAAPPVSLAVLQPTAGVHVCQAVAFLTPTYVEVVARLCSGTLTIAVTDGKDPWAISNGNAWRWSQTKRDLPPDPCHTPYSVDDISVMPSMFYAHTMGIHTLKRGTKCVTAWPFVGPLGQKEDLGKAATDIVVPLADQTFKLLAPRRIAEMPGGFAVLDVDPKQVSQARVARLALYGRPARLDVVTLEPSPTDAKQAPWGLAFRADGSMALAADHGLYFAELGGKKAELVLPWPPGAVQPEDGLERGCCDIGWLKDPLAGGAFLVARGGKVLVVDDHSFQPIATWTPTWAGGTIAPAGPIRVRSLTTSPERGSLVTVEVRGESEERVVVYGFGFPGAPFGGFLPAGWRAPAKSAPAP